jgi:hypothetical protein
MSEIRKSPECGEITMEMWSAGIEAFHKWNPETEEPAAMVAAVYWAMESIKRQKSP